MNPATQPRHQTTMLNHALTITLLFTAGLAGCAQLEGSLRPSGSRGDAEAAPTEHAAELPDGGLFQGDPPFTVRFVHQFAPSAFLRTTARAELCERADPATSTAPARVEIFDDNLFRVRVDGVEGVCSAQEEDAWCWAACVQTVLGHTLSRGAVGVSQRQLADYFHGEGRVRGAGMAVLVRALAPRIELDLAGQGVDLGADLRIQGADPLVEGLSSGELAVLGLDQGGGLGHAVVVLGATYARIEDAERTARLCDVGIRAACARLGVGSEGEAFLNERVREMNGLYALESVTVFDPWDGGGVREIEGEELRRTCDFILTQAAAREILTTPYNSLEFIDDQLASASEVGDVQDELTDLGGWASR